MNLGELAQSLEGLKLILPMYRVSPQLFVTKEHIISDSASTSASVLPSFSGSGESVVLSGLVTV
jgi:hypothetical protein